METAIKAKAINTAAEAIRIASFAPAQLHAVQQLILRIENEELALNLSLNDQPDLKDIAHNYQNAKGEFWVAQNELGEVIGTISLYDLGEGIADLRKMFVREDYRGEPYRLADKLYETLLAHAKATNFHTLYLESSYQFRATLAFYARKGFEEIPQSALPKNFPIIKTAECFFRLALD